MLDIIARRLFAAAAALALAGGAAHAQTDLRFALDWKFEGPAAPFFVAIDNGYFEEEGLSVTVDSGQGSLDALPKVASGNYPLGSADVNSLVRFLDQNPDAAVTAIFMIYDKPPFAIISTRDGGVSEPKDLEGKILGAPAPDGAYAQWNAFVAANDIDASAVTIENVGFPVREPMLASGNVNAITGFSFSSFINLKAAGVPASDINVLLMADYGLDLYGNVILANTDFLEANPEAVRGFLRAYTRGWQATASDPAAAVKSVIARNDVAVEEVELERLQMALRDNVLTDYVKANGVGDIDDDRFAAALVQIGQTYDFQSAPDAAQIFTREYLPAKEDRMLQ